MKISINTHSSIRIEDKNVIYFDPFEIENEAHDADIIYITHDHYDHFSIDDIRKIEKEDTVYVIPECMYNLLGGENVVVVKAGDKTTIEGYETEVIPSYNVNKQFHTKEKNYVGYIVTIDNQRVYVAGDCDANEDNLKISCDIALIPIGGKYTMDYAQAADFINHIKPKIAIPTHYGSIIGEKEDGKKFAELVEKEIRVQLIL